MRNIVYVTTHGPQWKVKCHHCSLDQVVATQAEAIRVARQHVASQGAGALAQILVQGTDSRFRDEWTYGKDPYPPIG